MMRDHSYGIIPLQKQGEEWFVLLIQHSKARYWGFPKGHAEGDESPIEAAKRELEEETNLRVVKLLSESYLEEQYQFTHNKRFIYKTVWYYVAEVQGDLKIQHEELSGAKWVPLSQASQSITYETDRNIYRKTIDLLK